MNFFIEDTKLRIYFDEVIKPYSPNSQVALELWREMVPFLNGQESEWAHELAQVEYLVSTFKKDSILIAELEELFLSFNDIRSLLDSFIVNNFNSIDPLFEGFHLKKFLWFSNKISKKILKEFDFNKANKFDWFQMATQSWQNWLSRFESDAQVSYPSFALEDIDNDLLKDLREQKRRLMRAEKQKELRIKAETEKKYSISFNADNYLVVQNDDTRYAMISNDQNLQILRRELSETVFTLNLADGITHVEIDKLSELIMSEEKRRMSEIIGGLRDFLPFWIEAHQLWGKFEILLKKAKMAIDLALNKPELKANSTSLAADGAYHPYLQSLWSNRKKGMKPLSYNIASNVTVFYGANMSGKTIALKTLGLIQALSQFGFFVPATRYQCQLFSHISIISGDYQNIEEGLSSFGAEIVRVERDFNNKNSLFLMDEVGKGTNPIEGEALAIAILRYLNQRKDSTSILISHFPNLIKEKEVNLYEVKDYQLVEVKKGNMVFEGINQAEKLGLFPSIISEAKKLLRERNEGMFDGKA